MGALIDLAAALLLLRLLPSLAFTSQHEEGENPFRATRSRQPREAPEKGWFCATPHRKSDTRKMMQMRFSSTTSAFPSLNGQFRR